MPSKPKYSQVDNTREVDWTQVGGAVFDENATLKQNLEQSLENEAVLQQVRKQYADILAKQQQEAKLKATQEAYEYEARLSAQGIQVSQKMKEQYLAKQYKQEAQSIINTYKEAGALNEKKGGLKGFQNTLESYKRAGENLASNKQQKSDLEAVINAINSKSEKSEQDISDLETLNAVLSEVNDEIKKGTWEKVFEDLNKAIDDLGNTINSAIDTYSEYQLSINARLQGRNGSSVADQYSQAYDTLVDAIGITPYFSLTDLMSNLNTLVSQGIATNVEQRAFLQTASEGIASTFDAWNSAMLRIVRLQQEDSTAARLGMEAYLTRFLNEMVDNTEYLTDVFDSVESALVEASSQMSTSASTEFEYVVQKWLGSLYGVGMSSSTAQSLATAIGYLGSGDIESLSSSDMQTLLVMASSYAGLDYADLLNNGLNATTTNELFKAIVEILASVSNLDSNVVKSEYADVLGVSISDITSASNLISSVDDIYNNLLSYSGMYDELEYQLQEYSSRMPISDMIDTYIDNLEYVLGGNIASNPATSAIWQITDLIQSTTQGINIPSIMALGSGIDLNSTVENLIKTGVVGVSTLGMIGDIITGIGTSMDASSILDALGISATSSSNIVSRGTGISSRSSGLSTSTSSYIGNSDSGAIYESTLNSAYDESNATLEQEIAESEDPSSDIKEYLVSTLENHMVNIDARLEEIANSLSGTLQVEVQDYGLVGLT